MEGTRSTDDQPDTSQLTRQQNFRIQNQWNTSSLVPATQGERWEEGAGDDEVDGDLASIHPSHIGHDRLRPSRLGTLTTSSECNRSPQVESFKKFRSLDFQMRFENVFTTPVSSVRSPLPRFNWADSSDVWKNMLKKDETFKRDMGLFKNHPELQPRMRSILLDWISEVCEVYRLHKETFTLAIDYIDRYLSVTANVPKVQLQLLGISALFIAAKLEEIYPPKLNDFAYVTDSACTEPEIIKQEMIMVKALKWNLTPVTTNSWLSLYLQTANVEHIHDPALGFVFPQYSTHAFIQISRLCDISLMDEGSLQFRYGLIAAAALYHHTNEQVVKEITGLNWADLYPCVRWMAPFAKAILEVGQTPMKFFPQIKNEDAHNIQTHNVDVVLLDRAVVYKKEMDAPNSAPPDLTSQLVSLLEQTDSSAQQSFSSTSHNSDNADHHPRNTSSPPSQRDSEPDLRSLELDSGDENVAPERPDGARFIPSSRSFVDVSQEEEEDEETEEEDGDMEHDHQHWDINS